MQTSLLKSGIIVLLCLVPAMGDYTFPSFDVTADFEPAAVAFDAGAVPAGDYSGYAVTLTWQANTNGAYSDEAEWDLSVGGDPFLLAAPGVSVAGVNSSWETVVLTWSGDLTHTYHGGDPLVFRAMQTLRNTSAPWTDVSLTLISGVVSPVTPPVAYDLGDVSEGWKSAFVPLDTNGVAWFKFTTPDVSTSGCDTLRVDTIGSSLSGGIYRSGDDSELAIYNAAGLLVGASDDVDMLGGALHAVASLGVDEGAVGAWLGELAGGEYYVAVAGFDAVFDIGTFGAASESAVQGVVRLNVTYGEPAFDCNANGAADVCDIATGVSPDVDTNGVPDECDDCNNNGILDGVEVAAGSAADCDGNAIPDECDALVSDCNFNGQVDACEIDERTATDCNKNGVPDSCDVASGVSVDCNANGIPDECDFVPTTLYRLHYGTRWDTDPWTGTVGMDTSTKGPGYFLWHSYLRDPVETNVSVSLADAAGLAIEPWVSGRMFALLDFFDAGQSFAGRMLVEVMPEFVVSPIRLVGPVDEAIEDIVFHPDGTLYGVVGNEGTVPGEIVTLDVATGAVGHPGIYAGRDPVASGQHTLAVSRSTGLLYHVYLSSKQGGVLILEMINPKTDEFDVVVTNADGEAFTAMIYDETRDLLLGYPYHRPLIEIDPKTGDATQNPSWLIDSRYNGLAYAYGAMDCNSNSVPDACDAAGGVASDFDGDGLLDMCDGDIDNDGFFNANDWCHDSPQGMGVNWHGGPFGDADDNCVVNLADYNPDGFVCLGVTGPLGGSQSTSNCLGVYDTDGDLDVDLKDFAVFQELFAAQP